MIFSRLSIAVIAMTLAACAQSVSVPPAERARIGLNGVVTAPTSRVVVQRADNLHSISRLYGIDDLELARINGLQPPYQLAQGQMLQLPPPINLGHTFDKTLTEAAPLAAVPNDTVVATDLSPVAPSSIISSTDLAPPGGAKASTSATPLVRSPAAKPVEVASVPPPAKAAPVALGNAAPQFSWPVNGATLSPYGAKAGGRQNDGINIGAPLGTPVRTAAEGNVVYSGDKIAGFGNLLLIKHSGGFATAYAHLQNVGVKQGDHVKAGQTIAQIGKTGNVSTPQLHFEIRKGTSAINPSSYLP